MVSVELPESWDFQGIVFAACCLYATARTTSTGATAWIRSGVESGSECATLYVLLLFESVCIVYDRPDYPRVKGVSIPVKRSGGCAQL